MHITGADAEGDIRVIEGPIIGSLSARYMKQSNLVSEQFSGSAQAYLTSAVHANGTDLQRLTQLTRDSACRQALDLGCGAGHAAFAIARAGSAVIAYDLSPKMLALVEEEAVQRGLLNIATQLGAAEHLPFANASCDLVATRFSAHHWSHVLAALAEVRRVLKYQPSLSHASTDDAKVGG